MKEIKTLTVGTETYRITDPEAARICDEAITQAAIWSSKHTVDMLCPAFSETGSIVACHPVAGYPLRVTAEEGATLTHCGKNLWDLNAGVTEVNYTVSGGGVNTRYGYQISLPAGTYTLHAELIGAVGSFMYVYVNGADGSYKKISEDIDLTKMNQMTVQLETADMLYIVKGSSGNAASANTLFSNYNVQIELGSTATPYEAYSGESFPYDPAVTVPAKPGVNTVWADNGSITVAARLDLAACVEKLQNAIALRGDV